MKRRSGYLFKRGDRWYVAWRLNGKLSMKALRTDEGQPVTSKREAEVARDKFMSPLTTADEVEVLRSIAGRIEGRKAELAKLDEKRNPALPFTQGWSEFLASRNRPDTGDATLRQYEFQWSRFADWMAQAHPEVTTLAGVTVAIAAEYAADLSKAGLSPGTFNKHVNLLGLVFNTLKESSRIIIPVNPWASITRQRLAVQSRRELSSAELRRVCKDATGELRVLLALGIYSGLRLGDCCTLRWHEVDLARKVISRIPNKTGRRNPKPIHIPVHSSLGALLSEIPEPRGQYVLPHMQELYTKRIDLVTDQIQGHFKKCGISLHKPGTGKPGVRAVIECGFHSLRHSFVSMCRSANVALSTVESLVGHSSPALTRHYSHTSELEAARAIALLPEVTSEAKAQPAKPSAEEILKQVEKLARAMKAKTWRAKRDELIGLVAADAVTK